MSKAMALLVTTVVIVVAITGLTFLIPVHDAAVTCFASDTEVTTQIRETANDSAPTPAIERGFPLMYYREPFPPNCTPTNQSPASSFNTKNLVSDLLIWTPLALLISLGLTKVRAKK